MLNAVNISKYISISFGKILVFHDKAIRYKKIQQHIDSQAFK